MPTVVCAMGMSPTACMFPHFVSGGRVHWTEMRRLPRVTVITGNDALVPQTEAISVSFFSTYFHMVILRVQILCLSPYSTSRFPCSRDSSAGIATGYGLDGWGSIHGTGKSFFFLLRSVQTCSGAHPASYSGYQRLIPWRQSGRSVKLTTHLYLLMRSRMVELYLQSPIRLHGVLRN
jgi:hypothetical protein